MVDANVCKKVFGKCVQEGEPIIYTPEPIIYKEILASLEVSRHLGHIGPVVLQLPQSRALIQLMQARLR